MELGVIVADAHMAFLAPIQLGQTVRVWTRVARLGTKSMRFEYELTDVETGTIFGKGDTVMVTYDYPTSQSIPIPADWREKISAFEERIQTA
jgi:acyl-CoA thioester hydrolase